MNLKDVRDFFMQKIFTREKIIEKEILIRRTITFENEVPTLFDYVMIFMKIWKLDCQNKIKDKLSMYHSTHKFLCEVESSAYDYTKSVLLDASMLKYSLSMIVASLITCCIEI